MKSLNTPFTHQEVKDLPMGFTASATYFGMGTDDNGRSYQRFAPNRRQRRASLQKSNNRKYHGRMVREQFVAGFRDDEGKWVPRAARPVGRVMKLTLASRVIRHLMKPQV